MIFARLEASVKSDEGLRLKPYRDTRGIWTIGYGSTFIGDDPITGDTATISEAFALQLLRAELWDSCLEAQKFFPDFDTLSNMRQEVLIEMAYQLGYEHLSQFVHFKASLQNGDWASAAQEMRNSAWHNQTPARAERLAMLMEAG